MWWLLVVFIVLQTTAEVLPAATNVPWTQPQAMKYGGFVFIALAVWALLTWQFSRKNR